MVLIGPVKGPRGTPKPYPPTPTPHLSPTLCQGYRRMGVGRGGAAVGHLPSPGPRPHSLTALTLHICQMPPDISDRSPFYREHAPVGALDTERPARLWNNGAWEGGGGRGKGGGGNLKERGQAWWGGGGGGEEVGARKRHV